MCARRLVYESALRCAVLVLAVVVVVVVGLFVGAGIVVRPEVVSLGACGCRDCRECSWGGCRQRSSP